MDEINELVNCNFNSIILNLVKDGVLEGNYMAAMAPGKFVIGK